MDITGLFSLGKAAIERIWPDPNKRAEEMRLLKALEQKGDIAELNAHVQLLLGQMEINKMEAQHKSIFVAGWRPFIGWVGGLSLAYAGLIYPLLTWVWAFASMEGSPPPLIETAALGTIVTGMLGIGTMRSYDKKQGTDTKAIS